MTTHLIGARIKALREERRLSQDDLARIFGFKDRQTVSAIETGERRVSAEELLTAVEKLGASLDYFTDPFLLVGEGKFSWRRHSRVGLESVKAFERVAGRWIAANRTLAPQVGKAARSCVSLSSSHRRAVSKRPWQQASASRRIRAGAIPAEKLPEVMERKLGILVLMVDAIDGVSGAACRLPELDAVLINRHEVAGRRNFDLAHELFHILTWDTMPPEHVEEATEHSKNRVEQLANNFASALLMPEASLRILSALRLKATSSLGSTQRPELAGHGNRAEMATGRTEPARAAQAKKFRTSALRNNGHDGPLGAPPPLFSKSFMEVLALAVDEGRVSARRAANLLDMTLEDFADLFARHGVEAPFDSTT